MAKELKGFLVDIKTRERLEFQYNPNEIGDDKSTQYLDIAIPGISHPRHQYVSGGNRRVTFKLFFFKGDVKKQVAWLQSLLYPEHSGTMLKSPPHRVIFIFGGFFVSSPAKPDLEEQPIYTGRRKGCVFRNY